MATVSLSTIDAAIATRIEAQLSGFKESNTVSALLRTPSSIVDKGFVLLIDSGTSLDGTTRGLRQKTESRIEAGLRVEFARKLNKNQPTTRRAAQDNVDALIKALLNVSWTSTIGSGGVRFVFKTYSIAYSGEGQAIIGSVNFNVSYEIDLT